MNRTLLALTGVLCALGGMAQSMPYNPDANDDGYITSPDLLSFLPLFGSQVGIDSSLTCDYDGTPIEEFLGNVWNGDVIIDSILVQYHTIDSAEVYIAGCPDPIWETVSYERAWTVPFDHYDNSPPSFVYSAVVQGYYRSFRIWYYEATGRFKFAVNDIEVSYLQIESVLGDDYSFAKNEENGSDNWTIPFPTDAAAMDENGIHFEYWGGFLSGATYVNILPYWHYAE